MKNYTQKKIIKKEVIQIVVLILVLIIAFLLLIYYPENVRVNINYGTKYSYSDFGKYESLMTFIHNYEDIVISKGGIIFLLINISILIQKLLSSKNKIIVNLLILIKHALLVVTYFMITSTMLLLYLRIQGIMITTSMCECPVTIREIKQ